MLLRPARRRPIVSSVWQGMHSPLRFRGLTKIRLLQPASAAWKRQNSGLQPTRLKLRPARNGSCAVSSSQRDHSCFGNDSVDAGLQQKMRCRILGFRARGMVPEETPRRSAAFIVALFLPRPPLETWTLCPGFFSPFSAADRIWSRSAFARCTRQSEPIRNQRRRPDTTGKASSIASTMIRSSFVAHVVGARGAVLPMRLALGGARPNCGCAEGPVALSVFGRCFAGQPLG